jgi:hypothetical protein
LPSFIFVEADDVGILSEAASADHHVVFADEALPGSADSAGSTVFSVLAWVSSPEKVGHICGNYNTQYYYIKIQFIYFKNHFGMISNVLNNLSFISNLKIFF